MCFQDNPEFFLYGRQAREAETIEKITSLVMQHNVSQIKWGGCLQWRKTPALEAVYEMLALDVLHEFHDIELRVVAKSVFVRGEKGGEIMQKREAIDGRVANNCFRNALVLSLDVSSVEGAKQPVTTRVKLRVYVSSTVGSKDNKFQLCPMGDQLHRWWDAAFVSNVMDSFLALVTSKFSPGATRPIGEVSEMHVDTGTIVVTGFKNAEELYGHKTVWCVDSLVGIFQNSNNLDTEGHLSVQNSRGGFMLSPSRRDLKRFIPQGRLPASPTIYFFWNTGSAQVFVRSELDVVPIMSWLKNMVLKHYETVLQPAQLDWSGKRHFEQFTAPCLKHLETWCKKCQQLLVDPEQKIDAKIHASTHRAPVPEELWDRTAPLGVPASFPAFFQSFKFLPSTPRRPEDMIEMDESSDTEEGRLTGQKRGGEDEDSGAAAALMRLISPGAKPATPHVKRQRDDLSSTPPTVQSRRREQGGDKVADRADQKLGIAALLETKPKEEEDEDAEEEEEEKPITTLPPRSTKPPPMPMFPFPAMFKPPGMTPMPPPSLPGMPPPPLPGMPPFTPANFFKFMTAFRPPGNQPWLHRNNLDAIPTEDGAA